MPHQRPSAEISRTVEGWRCPLCYCTGHTRVVVDRPNGTPYKTAFYECMRCTVMFRDPDQFARLGVPVRRWANDVGPKTLAEARRYWLGPTPDEPK